MLTCVKYGEVDGQKVQVTRSESALDLSASAVRAQENFLELFPTGNVQRRSYQAP